MIPPSPLRPTPLTTTNTTKVLVVDNLTTAYPATLSNLLALLDLHHLYQSTHTPTPKPLLRFHRLDYRSREFPLLLESYSDLVMTIDAEGTQHMASRSRIKGVVHLAPVSVTRPISWRGGSGGGGDVGRLMRRLRRYGMEGVVVFGGLDGDGGLIVDGLAGRMVVMRCGGQVVGCDGSGLLGGGPRGAAVSTDRLGEGGGFLHVLDVARAFVAALDWQGGGQAGVRVVELGLRGKRCRDKDMERSESMVERFMEGSGVYVPRGGPVWRPKKSVVGRAVRLWKLVRRW